MKAPFIRAFVAFLFLIPGVLVAQLQNNASVEGTAVRAGTTDPVAGARVALIASDQRSTVAPITVLADASGRFVFSSVPPGPYLLIALKDGYLKATYRADTPPSGLLLTARQSVKGVILPMTPTSTIAGRIKNAQGEPMGNVLVRAERSSYQDGRRTLEPAVTVVTNDLGDYRLYFLPPGRYLVSARPDEGPGVQPDGKAIVGTLGTMPGNPFGRVQDFFSTTTLQTLAELGFVSAAETGETYLATYYPGVPDPTSATVVDLRPGATFNNADFVVSAVAAVSVRGRIGNIPAGRSGEVSVWLMAELHGASGWLSQVAGRVSDTGEFEFRGVAPGLYDVVATLGDLPEDITFTGPDISPGGPEDRTTGTPPSPRLVAKGSVQASSQDVNDVQLSLSEGYSFRGRITVEGASPDKNEALTKGLTIQLRPDPETFETAPMPAEVGTNGMFTVKGVVPGRYAIELQNGGALMKDLTDPYIQSAEMGGVDAQNPTLLIDGEPRGELQIVIADERGTVAATVVNEKGNLVPGAQIVLVPDVPKRQHYNLFRAARSSNTGRANLYSVPGDYTVYAFEEIEEDTWWDPAVLQKYQGRGQPVRISASGTQKVELRVIPRQ